MAKFAITIWYSIYEELSKCVQKTNNYNFNQQEVPASFEPMTYRIGSSVLTTEPPFIPSTRQFSVAVMYSVFLLFHGPY